MRGCCLQLPSATVAQSVSPRSQVSLSQLQLSPPSHPCHLHPCAPCPDPQPCSSPAAGTVPGLPRACSGSGAGGSHARAQHHEDAQMDRMGSTGAGLAPDGTGHPPASPHTRHVPTKPDTNTAALPPLAQPPSPRQTLQVFNKKVQKNVHGNKTPVPVAPAMAGGRTG